MRFFSSIIQRLGVSWGACVLSRVNGILTLWTNLVLALIQTTSQPAILRWNRNPRGWSKCLIQTGHFVFEIYIYVKYDNYYIYVKYDIIYICVFYIYIYTHHIYFCETFAKSILIFGGTHVGIHDINISNLFFRSNMFCSQTKKNLLPKLNFRSIPIYQWKHTVNRIVLISEPSFLAGQIVPLP